MRKSSATSELHDYNKTMKLGILSDTHFTSLADGLHFMETLCVGPFSDVDLILHAGDIVHPDLLYCFNDRPVLAVRGNCDEPSTGLPERRIEEIAGYRIGLTHGWGPPKGIVGQVLGSFADEQLDVLVFGHTHYPFCRLCDDLLLINPGSAIDRRDAPYHSVGLLELGSTIQASIVNLDTWSEDSATQEGMKL